MPHLNAVPDDAGICSRYAYLMQNYINKTAIWLIMSPILWVIIGIIAAYILLNIFSREFRKFSKWFSRISAVMFVIFAIVAVFVYLDLSKLAKDFPVKQSVFAFDNNGNISTAFFITFPNKSDVMQGVRMLSQQQIDDLNAKFTQKDYAAMLDGNYKLVIVKRKSLEDNLPVALEFNKIFYSRDEIISIITQPNGFDLFFDKFFQESKFPAGVDKETVKERLLQELKLSNANDIKSYMFIFAFVTGVLGGSQGSPLNTITLLEQYQKGYIIVYPETISLKMFKLVPFSTVKNIMQDLSPKEAEILNKPAETAEQA